MRRRTADASLLGLGLAGAVHALWATGSSWPAATRGELADLVVGVRPFPSVAMTLGVVALIAVGAGMVEAEARRLQGVVEGGPDWPDGDASSALPSAAQRWLRVGAWGVPSVLAVRGVGGLIVSAAELRPATEIFRHWDLRLYSPLCLVLAALTFAAVRPHSSEAATPRQ